ncbi:acyltransferase family protein [Sphingomonas sp. TX0543]|uniref:acyltransferase family protein n=1 Tax=unclassified Sphingomonas TaxID=196159 RepID=UPI0010F79B32|nr:acyltransferase [Sphingomonas sp. 3P27F8]
MNNRGGAPAIAADRPASPSAGYIPGFDGLRAIAVGMVLIAHAGYGKLVPGGFGVTIFFAISGYLICTLLINEFARTGTINLKLFYVRRILRLYPELIALVILCLIAGAVLGLRATTAEKFAGLFYYMNYYYVFGAHYTEAESYPWRQLWSLAIEEHFYFFFPGLMLFITRTWRSRMALALALVTIPFLWRFVTYFWLGLPWQYNYVATDTRIDSIAWGCLLALAMRRPDGGERAMSELWFISRPAVFLGFALIIGSLLYRDEAFRWTWRFTVQGIGIVLLIANVLFDPRWRGVVRVLEWAPVRYVGRISYGLYLYHMLFNRVIEEIWPTISPPVLLPVSIVGSLIIASISYNALEVPLKSLRRKLGSHVR